ncbi:MAG: TRAP transporter substrate-binding protein DctP, partial [Pseudomonadota bacterium]|nr:TRAP transporter substrate-binding protein DctP [Pseudomonadota bacterium]
DIKQMRMFTAAGDPEMVQIFRRNGFRPVALAAADIMSGLQTGMFEALPTTPLAALAFQWYRTAGYMHEQGLGPVIGATVVSKRVWEQIPEQHRSIILRSAKSAENRLREEIPAQEREAVNEMKRRGLRVTTSIDPSEWQLEADRLSHSMRGSVVPSAVLGQALAERKAYRQGAVTAFMPAEENNQIPRVYWCPQ